jgi:hypothetical protein
MRLPGTAAQSGLLRCGRSLKIQLGTGIALGVLCTGQSVMVRV